MEIVTAKSDSSFIDLEAYFLSIYLLNYIRGLNLFLLTKQVCTCEICFMVSSCILMRFGRFFVLMVLVIGTYLWYSQTVIANRH